MLVANSLDLWQKDAFFSAAEEVQQSADIMESAYRTWLKAKREGLMPQRLDEIGRELQMSLGTAKWQLEEFERAVNSSYRKNGDDMAITRHRQFVSVIEDQISRVETALRNSLNVEGKKPFRWVDLDEEECDDLALFLSGTPGTSQWTKDSGLKNGATLTSSFSGYDTEEICSLGSKNSSKIQTPNLDRSSEELLISNEVKSFVTLKESEILQIRENISHQADQATSNRRGWCSADRSALEIIIDDDRDDRRRNVCTEATLKEKGSAKPFFWSSREENCHGAKGMLIHTQIKMINWIKQHLRVGHRSQRQQQVSPVLLVNSKRYILAFMLIIFLAVPFLLYST